MATLLLDSKCIPTYDTLGAAFRRQACQNLQTEPFIDGRVWESRPCDVGESPSSSEPGFKREGDGSRDLHSGEQHMNTVGVDSRSSVFSALAATIFGEEV